MKRYVLAAVFCVLLAVPAIALGGHSQSGQVVADLGFKPQPDGFGFENYGASNDDLNPATMQLLFGAAVCAGGTSGANCTLHPQAQTWMDNQNRSMQGGHCYGFSVSALVFFDKRKAQAGQFGAATTNTLTQSPKLANYIAYTWVHQTLDRVTDARVTGSPNQIVDALIANFRNKGGELYTIAFFKRDGNGGHAVTPFAIERRPNNIDAILIYDNNFPNDTRAMLVDRTKNTWTYNASTNPNEPSEQYEGDAQTQSLMLYPTLPGLGVQPCPFCGAAAQQARTAGSAVPRYDSYFLTGDPRNQARMTLTDSGGRKLGYVGNRFVNRIPGTRVVRPLLDVPVGKRKQQPQYKVPAGRPVTITIDGSKLARPTTVQLGVVIRGRFIGIRRIQLAPHRVVTVHRNAAGTSFTYTSGKGQPGKPVFALGYQGVKSDRSFTIETHGVKGGSSVGLTLDDHAGTLQIDATDDDAPLVYDLSMSTIDEDGVTEINADDQQLDDESGTLDYDGWTDEDSPPPIDVDEDNGGDTGD